MDRREKTVKQLQNLARILADNHQNNSTLNKGLKAKKGYARCILIVGAGASYSADPLLFPKGDIAADKIEDNLRITNWPKEIRNKNIELKRAQRLLRKAEKDSFEERLSRLTHFTTERQVHEELKNLFDNKIYPNLAYELIAHLFKNRFIDVIIDFNFDETLSHLLEEELKSAQWVKIVTDGDVKEYKDILVDEKLNSPVYIKSHGTVSHKSSMRFTKDQYLSIPDDISKLMFSLFTDQLKSHDITQLKTEYKELKEVLKNKQDDENDNDRKTKVTRLSDLKELIDSEDFARAPSFLNLNFISLGFEMESIELNQLIKEAQEKFKALKTFKITKRKVKIDLNYFDYKQEATPSYFDDRKTNISPHAYVDSLNLIHLQSIPNAFLEVTELGGQQTRTRLSEAENAMSALEFQLKQPPKQANEHNTAAAHYHRYQFSKLWKTDFQANSATDKKEIDKRRSSFKTNRDKNPFHTAAYFKARFLYECCLEVVRNKGYLDLEDALSIKTRIGFYYDIYYHTLRSTKKLKELESVTDLLSDIGFSDLNASIPGASLNQDGEFWGIKAWMSAYELMSVDDLLEAWKLGNSNPLATWIHTYFHQPKTTTPYQHLSEIYNSDPCKVYPNFDDGRLYFFKDITKPNLLFSESLLVDYVNQPFEGEITWNRAIIVQDYGVSFAKSFSEYIRKLCSGEAQAPTSAEPLKICLIISDIRFGRKSVKDAYEALTRCVNALSLRIDVFYLPPNLHNHHLHTFYRLEEDALDTINFAQSCYYYKRTTRNEMNGVYFNDDRGAYNQEVILHSGLRALGRSAWIASIIREGTTMRSVDIVKDEVKQVGDFYTGFKQQATFSGDHVRAGFDAFDAALHDFYADAYRVVKPEKHPKRPTIDLPHTAAYAPSRPLGRNHWLK